ncbi:hypothetical protein AWB78_06538 [Caballeronia calidae]|uniref:Uncharacterized protein n=1 Tax=Caballeronia calidae TaxID=1777139 RepID=A0A158E8U1_9BURK|nr:hypothetical protein AWB78_06538 [Caballeronia calidae]
MAGPRRGSMGGRARRARLHRARPVKQRHHGSSNSPCSAGCATSGGSNPDRHRLECRFDVDRAHCGTRHETGRPGNSDREFSLQRRGDDRLLPVPATILACRCGTGRQPRHGGRPGAFDLQPHRRSSTSRSLCFSLLHCRGSSHRFATGCTPTSSPRVPPRRCDLPDRNRTSLASTLGGLGSTNRRSCRFGRRLDSPKLKTGVGRQPSFLLLLGRVLPGVTAVANRLTVKKPLGCQ